MLYKYNLAENSLSVYLFRIEVVMLEHYFSKIETIDNIRGSWLGEPIERYVTWLAKHGYSSRTVWRRVPILKQFGEFAQCRGALKTCESDLSTPVAHHQKCKWKDDSELIKWLKSL